MFRIKKCTLPIQVMHNIFWPVWIFVVAKVKKTGIKVLQVEMFKMHLLLWKYTENPL